MKIIKFQKKKSYNYKRKVFVRNLVLKISVGIHAFEKKKKQRVRFNIDIVLDPDVFPENNNLNSIVNYEAVIKNTSSVGIEIEKSKLNEHPKR